MHLTPRRAPATTCPVPTKSAMANLVVALCVTAALLAMATLLAPSPIAAQTVDTLAFKDLSYRMAGPFRGGRSSAATGFPNDPDRWLMGTTGGGVWESTDNGVSWQNITDGYFGGSIGAVKVADSDPNVIYAGQGSVDIRGNTSTGRGAWKSMDAGRTWTFIGLPEAGQIGRIEVHPRDHDLVYMAALGHPFGKNPERGIFRSRDGGDTWEHVLALNDSTGASDLTMDMTNPRILYAGMWRGERKPWALISGAEEGGVYKSTDGGDSWTKLGGGLPEGIVGKVGVSVSARRSGPGMGDHRGRAGRGRLQLRRRGRHVDAHQLRQQPAPAGLVLHPRAGPPRRPEHRVRAQHQPVPVGRRRDDLRSHRGSPW